MLPPSPRLRRTGRRGAPTPRAPETVGSNFFLTDRRLSVSFKKGGFDALSAEAGAESVTSQPLSFLYWLRGRVSYVETSEHLINHLTPLSLKAT
ncbi:hypothetical protein A2865_03420 [Candidatus Woesebacteria bacterium RIFCSPHIGHO2_01_FULL_39_17]|nr:MAG: hypothetical protein A2865_03420 [Candidatus Woesebacteria bacterium RIFCSPHIGHO2_01_FULL_39_17]